MTEKQIREFIKEELTGMLNEQRTETGKALYKGYDSLQNYAIEVIGNSGDYPEVDDEEGIKFESELEEICQKAVLEIDNLLLKWK